MPYDSRLAKLVDQAIVLFKMIEQDGTPVMRTQMRILLFIIGQQMAKRR